MTDQTEMERGATPEMANEQEETALANIKRRMEDIVASTLILEQQHLSKKQKAAVLRIQTVAVNLVDDIERGYINIEWGRNALR